MEYTSAVEKESGRYPGVKFIVSRMSLARRLELGRRIRGAGLKSEFLQASDRVDDQIEAGIIQRQIERLYLEWGLKWISGLSIDGEAATPELLIESGPEDLAAEILDAIKSEIYLSEGERKN
jgi:hypothetical protein